MNEIWKDIEGYEGKYQVSNLGRVKSLNYRHTGKEQILEPGNTKGYLRVNLYQNGKMNRKSIHRLVAMAFINNFDNLPQVNHIDENKENNRVDNLEWCDAKYNNNYGTARARTSKTQMETMPTMKNVICVEMGVVFPSAMKAERCTGADHSNIIKCCRGKKKTAGGYHWRYAD